MWCSACTAVALLQLHTLNLQNSHVLHNYILYLIPRHVAKLFHVRAAYYKFCGYMSLLRVFP